MRIGLSRLPAYDDEAVASGGGRDTGCTGSAAKEAPTDILMETEFVGG